MGYNSLTEDVNERKPNGNRRVYVRVYVRVIVTKPRTFSGVNMGRIGCVFGVENRVEMGVYLPV